MCVCDYCGLGNCNVMMQQHVGQTRRIVVDVIPHSPAMRATPVHPRPCVRLHYLSKRTPRESVATNQTLRPICKQTTQVRTHASTVDQQPQQQQQWEDTRPTPQAIATALTQEIHTEQVWCFFHNTYSTVHLVPYPQQLSCLNPKIQKPTALYSPRKLS